MKEIVVAIFGLGLGCDALLFVPHVVAIGHGLYQHDLSLILGMAAALLTCGSVTMLKVFYRVRRVRAGVVIG